jgi:hypothetical protein
MKFKPGESVVCIDDSFSWARRHYRSYRLTFPVRGKCYVVRKYIVKGKYPAIVLQGIHNPDVKYNDGMWREAGFWDERFERAPGIEEIKKIADDVDLWLGHEDEPDLHPTMTPEKEDA